MQRRDAIKAIGGIGALTAGGFGLVALTGGASATSDADYNDVSVTSDDGTVDYVAIYGASTVTWDGFDSTATLFRIVNEARVVNQTKWVELNDTGEVPLDNDDWGSDDESLSGPGTSGTIETAIGLQSNGNHDPETDWHIVGDDPDGYGLPADSIDPSSLEVNSDGGDDTFTIELRSTYTWYDAQGSRIFRETFTSGLDVNVNNEPASADGSSSNEGAVAE